MPFYLRAAIKIKATIKNHNAAYQIASSLLAFKKNVSNLFRQNNGRKRYYQKIRDIKNRKEIILDIKHGGLGDWLAYTTLPRLLTEKYNVDFYISEESVERLRNKDTFKLCFEINPYFRGIKKSHNYFRLNIFSCEKSIYNFLFDLKGKNITEILEAQFRIQHRGIPEIYYEPRLLEPYRYTILVDKNHISGKKLGWEYDDQMFKNEIEKYSDNISRIKYIDPTKQDLFTYTDMIFSCRRFISALSGGAVLASCFEKPFSVILLKNVSRGGVSIWVFQSSKAEYIKIK